MRLTRIDAFRANDHCRNFQQMVNSRADDEVLGQSLSAFIEACETWRAFASFEQF